MDETDLMTVEDVAQRLGVSRQRVNKLIADERLPAIKLSPKVVVIRREDVEAFEKLPRVRTGRPQGSKNRPKKTGRPRKEK